MSRRCLGCMELFGDEFELCPHCGYIVGTHAEEAIHMEPGTILHDRYIIGRVLGFGGFGVTYIGWDGKLEQKVAVKEYLPGEFSTRMPGQSQVTVFNGEKNEQFHDGLKKFVEEAKRLAKFQNEPGIVKIFDSFEENETAYIVMEYLDGETLTSYLKREKTIPEDQAVSMLTPVMESLQVVHAEGLLHRDIAPDNIFFTKSGEVKLIDFGASRYATTSHSRSLTVIIKPGYSPEEQYRSRGDQGPYTDVYAIAATLYKMITGKTPPDAMERRAKYETQNKDILIEPHKLTKNISVNREVAILNGMNVRIEDRTPDIAAFIGELNANPPAKRRYGKIKKIDIYSWPLWVKILVPSLMAAVIAFGVLILTGVINFSKYTKEVVIPDNIMIAPDVEGIYQEEAIDKIVQSELLAEIGGSMESEYIAAGKVVMQTPVGGAFLEKNGTVLLTISSGNGVEEADGDIATVPFLVGDTKEEAIQKLAIAGLGTPIIEEVNDDNIAAGLVISSSIKEGEKVKVGTVLTLKVSKGAASFKVPNVVGQKEAAAKSALEKLGMAVTVEYEKSSSVAEGNVIRQTKTANTDAKRGDKVTIVVSSGEDTITVANVVGKTQSDARSTLERQGFAVYVRENTSNTVAAGKVISQSPAAGTSQREGSTVTIFVSTGKKAVTVSYDANGGSVSKSSDTRYYGDTYASLPTPTRTGYTFTGWYTSKTGGSHVTVSTTITSSSSHTLYAHWSGARYTVTLNPSGGTVSPSTITVSYGETYGTLPTPTRSGYGFSGWYTSAGGGTKIESGTTVSTKGAHTLYAQWSSSKYTVTFDPNGGSVSETSKRIYYNSVYGDLPTPTRSGFEFLGWYLDNTKITSDKRLSVAKNVTLRAHWQSGWTLASQVPSGAKIIETKWVYTQREYTQSASSAMSGWTRYDSKQTGWGAWSGWSTSNPSNGSRNVESRSVYDHTEYHYYRWTNGTGCYTYQYNSGYWLEEQWFTYVLPTTSQYTDFGYIGTDIPRYWWIKAESSYNHSVDRTFTRSINRTEWRYQDPAYTYYYYRDSQRESSSDPSGQSNVSNISKHVRYIVE